MKAEILISLLHLGLPTIADTIEPLPRKQNQFPKAAPRQPHWLFFHYVLAKYRSLNAAPTSKCCSLWAQVTGYKLGDHLYGVRVKSEAFFSATSALGPPLLLTNQQEFYHWPWGIESTEHFRGDPVPFRCSKQ